MFDDWDKITNIYTNATATGKSFLDSDLISKYIKKRSQISNLSNHISRQLILYCRLSVANLTNKSELESFIAENSLDGNLITSIVEMCMNMYISEADYSKTTPSISYETRLQVLSGARKSIQHLWNDKELKLSLLETSVRYNLPSVKSFMVTAYDIVLGFYKIEDTVPLLQQELELDPKTAALLGAEVLEFLAPLSDPNWQPPVEENEDQPNDVMNDLNTAVEPEASRIPIKSPALFGTPSTPESVATPMPIPQPAPMVNPLATETPVYEPTPASYVSTPTPTPVYQSTQPVTTPAPAPLSTIPSYTPAPTPPIPVAPTLAPDRPRWSTEI